MPQMNHQAQAQHSGTDKLKIPSRSMYYDPEVGGSLGIKVYKSLGGGESYDISFRNSKIPSYFSEQTGFLGLGGKAEYSAVGISKINGSKISNNNPKQIAAALAVLKANSKFEVEVIYKSEDGKFKTKKHIINVGHETGYLGAITTGATSEELKDPKFTGDSKALKETKGKESYIKINSVTSNSPAAIAGLKKGDVIVAYKLDSSMTTVSPKPQQWEKASYNDAFSSFLNNRFEGDQISLLIRREVNGKLQEMKIAAKLGGFASRVTKYTPDDIKNVREYKF